MNKNNFNFAAAFEKVLKKMDILYSSDPLENGTYFQTGPVPTGDFETCFHIYVGDDGRLCMTFRPMGRIPSEMAPGLKRHFVRTMYFASAIKIIEDSSHFAAVQYESILPADEELVEDEFLGALACINEEYYISLSWAMQGYWNDIAKGEKELC